MKGHRKVLGLILMGLVLGVAAQAQEKAKTEKKPTEHVQGKAAVKGAVVDLQDRPIPGVQLTFQLEELSLFVRLDRDGRKGRVLRR